MKAVRNLHTFEGGRGDFHAWLLTIARNRVIDLARQAVRRPEFLGTDELEDMTAGDSDPAQIAERRSTGERVRQVIDALSPDQRDVMVLRVLSGLNLEETARVLGKSVGAVKSLQVRATAQIRRRMAQEAVSL
jgi:RNA polymerase sigma-70 factor (ECF subfamily)